MTASRPKPSELDHEVIHQAIAQGSRSAFIRLYHHYEGKVRYGVARAALRSGRGRDVEELIQEIWCRLMSNGRRLLSYYDPARGRFGPYIGWVAYQQTLHLVHQQRRKNRAEGLPGDGDEFVDERAASFGTKVIQSDLFQKLLERVDAQLSDLDRVLLREHYLSGRTLRELAQELGLTEDTVYQRNRRLKKKLIRVGQQLEPPPPEPASPIATPTVALLLAMALTTEVAPSASAWIS